MVEDLLSFVPPVAFLVATWIEGWPPHHRFPLGFYRRDVNRLSRERGRATGVGLFLIVDFRHTLLTAENPTMGSVRVLGVTFWFGWVMIAALVYSSVPPIIFGRLKLKPARALHDKILFA